MPKNKKKNDFFDFFKFYDFGREGTVGADTYS